MDSKLFNFEFITIDALFTEIKSLNALTSIRKETLPIKIIQENINIFSCVLFNNLNNNIAVAQFPYKLKFADVSPVFKKDCKTDKSKVYKRLIFYQLNNHSESILSNLQCGFRKGNSAQYCMILLLEKWRKSIDNRGCAGALMTDMDMSKAFDSPPHGLLIAKLKCIWFGHSIFTVMS